MGIPNKIYLQIEGDNFGDWEGVTWCIDKINDDDVTYVLESDLAACQSERDALRKRIKFLAEYDREEICKDDFAYDRLKRFFQDELRALIAGKEEG